MAGADNAISGAILDAAQMADDGLVIVYTGGGKGKTTAALGMALRAVGHDKRVCMIQFIKGSWHYGELDSSKLLSPNFELVASGHGFVGIMDDTSDREVHVKVAAESMREAAKRISSGKYDIVMLDEVNYATSLGLVDAADVLRLISSRPRELTLVLTGNRADERILEAADLITEMKEVRHPFKRGIRAKKGIDF